MRSALALQAMIPAFLSRTRTPSAIAAMTERYRVSLSTKACSARLRSVMSMMVPIKPATLPSARVSVAL